MLYLLRAFAILILLAGGALAQTACGVKGDLVCPGCSVTCASGQQAFCEEGEQTGATCWSSNICECLNPSQAPSVYTPGPNGEPNRNACSTPGDGPCMGCSASCPPDERPSCAPAVPDPVDRNACRRTAKCLCVK